MTCPNCGAHMIELACKLVCPDCSYFQDCGDGMLRTVVSYRSLVERPSG